MLRPDQLDRLLVQTEEGAFETVGGVPVPVVSRSIVGGGGNLPASVPVDFGGVAQEVWIYGTLTAATTVVVSNYVAGCSLVFMVTQDAVGGRSLNLYDSVGGTLGGVVSDAESANSTVTRTIWCADAATIIGPWPVD